MNSRQLALQAIAHDGSCRMPWTLYLSKELNEKLVRQWGPRAQWPCPPDDIIRILWQVTAADVSPTLFKDRFNCQWQREHGGYIFVNPPLTEPDARHIPRIDLISPADIDAIVQTRRTHPDRFIFYQFTTCLSERLWCLRGLEQALMDYLLHPSFVHEALDILMDMHMRALNQLLSLPIDGVTFGDDFGAQRGLMISRAVFLEFYKPRLGRLYEKVRSAGKVVGQHSCGDNTELMGDFVDIGLQVFHPLQPEAMDISEIKRQFGRHLTFRGGIGTQGALVFGTPDEARAEVRQAVEILGESGGYWLETSKPLPMETPLENAVAIIDEMARILAS